MVINLKGKYAKTVYNALLIQEAAYNSSIKQLSEAIASGKIVFELVEIMPISGDKQFTTKLESMQQAMQEMQKKHKSLQHDVKEVSAILDIINPNRKK